MIKNESDIVDLIRKDEWMMNLLKAVRAENVLDCWICAGFVRSKIWDTLHGFNERTPLPDIDVIYFDDKNTGEEEEKKIEKNLTSMLPGIPWSVKNEARMHLRNSVEAYTSSNDAVSKFPETATALAVKLDSCNRVILFAPHGVEDVINLTVKPTPYFEADKERLAVYEERVRHKNWHVTWDQLKIFRVESEVDNAYKTGKHVKKD